MADVEAPMAGPLPTTSSPPPAEPSSDPTPDPSSPSHALTTTTAEEPALTTTTKPKKTIIRKKRRPARPQVDPSSIKTSELPPQTGTIFNIWYNKWSGGDREDKYLSKTHAEGRCSIAKDSGYTRADKVAGSYFCMFFARGMCPKGHECEYLHRLPTLHDMFNPNIDAFGRDKHSDYRDDMGGVGSFMRQNRTLYVGRIHVTDDIEEVVARHFAEWGQIDRIRVLTSRGVAFVTYTNEANSQFAKEAMAHQSLDHSEVLNVRWATVDPNPLAAAREARKIDEQAAEAVRRALPEEYVREIEAGGRKAIAAGADGADGQGDARKRRRLVEEGYGLEGYRVPDEVWYARGIEEAGQEGRAVGAGEVKPALVAPGGLLSGSTLDALRSHAAQTNGAGFAATKAAPASGGPLVAYGSDGESD
ncbi:MAG: Pre-mRNA-splicing factor [Piccolia ochrophora]|nr:MAG: Pre-mRNA-splicing factor [Piccolia ochrophora]